MSTPSDGPVRIELIFPAEQDFYFDWDAKYERGERPTRWPYGLERLAWYADEVDLVYVQRPRKWRRMIRPLTDRLAAARIARRPGRDIGLTWDEQMAIRMVTGRRHREMYSGAIWIADRVARGEHQYNELMIGALKETTGIWLNSAPQLEPTREIVGPGPRLQFAVYGVEEDFFAPTPLPEDPAVLSIGTDRDRDWDTLLAVYARIHERMPHVPLLMQADAELDVPDYVEVLPYMDFATLKEAYARAGVVAIALRENLHVSGLTVSLESRALGRPVVASRTVGMEDFMTDGLDISLVPVGDAEAMAAEVMRLLTDRSAAQERARAGRAEIERYLTLDHLAADLARLMHLERRATPGRLRNLGAR